MSEATEVPLRTLASGQSARIRVWTRDGGSTRTVLETTELLLEAPNWTRDGRLLVNGDGELGLCPSTGRSRRSGCRPRDSWAPDAAAFAFVDCPIAAHGVDAEDEE